MSVRELELCSRCGARLTASASGACSECRESRPRPPTPAVVAVVDPCSACGATEHGDFRHPTTAAVLCGSCAIPYHEAE
jgi:hypothetical protein